MSKNERQSIVLIYLIKCFQGNLGTDLMLANMQWFELLRTALLYYALILASLLFQVLRLPNIIRFFHNGIINKWNDFMSW